MTIGFNRVYEDRNHKNRHYEIWDDYDYDHHEEIKRQIVLTSSEFEKLFKAMATELGYKLIKIDNRND